MEIKPLPDDSLLDAYNLAARAEKLPGGSTGVYRVANVVLKHIRETSLENNHSPDLAGWIAEFSAKISQKGFRLARGVPTKNGCWVTDSGWTAWTFVEGSHATPADIPDCVIAIDCLHRALRDISKNPLLDESVTPWAKAHRWCLGDRADHVHAVVRTLVDQLYQLRRPVAGQPYQVIHGDLNAENILVSPGLPPAFIDFSPFWGPPELALAIFANWIGPRSGDIKALEHFRKIPDFDQWLIRAGIRMLLVTSESPDWDNSSEKAAAEMILNYARRSA